MLTPDRADTQPPRPADEAERQEILRSLRLGTAPPEPAFDALAHAARALTGCEISLVTLVDADQALHVARDGTTLQQTARADAFCAHAITQPTLFEVVDLREDPRFAHNPLVQGEDGLRHYAAAPLLVEGRALGTLCVLDRVPGRLDAAACTHLTGLASVVSDLLRQRRDRLALEDQAERLRDLARASGDWGWEVDAELHCRWLSDEFAAATGLAAGQVLGRLIDAEPQVDNAGQDLQPPRDLLQLLQGRQAFSRVITRCETPRGRLCISRSALPVLDAAGSFRGYRGSARDVTARLERDALLREKAAAEHASRAKSEFLSRVSHELRTPLNAILGFAQLMALDQQHPLGAQQAHRVDGVISAGQQLLDLIDDVLQIAGIEQATKPLQSLPVDLPAVARACLSSVQPLADRHQVRMAMTLPPGLHALGDARAVEQVLMNLLSNAIKYNRPGGSVMLAAQVGDGQVALSVTDTGPGLSPAELAQLFQPFMRLGAHRRRQSGSGLGLVIVQQLARAMGGVASARSVPGQGSCFSVRLPLAQHAAQTAHADPTPRPAAADSTAPRTVLYIEDEPLNVILMQEVFKARPAWALHVARDGEEGVAAALTQQPDLALIDMNLPDFNGLEVLRRLRSHPQTRALRCVALSADALPEQIATARAAGFHDYWTKPIDLSHLLEAVGQAFPIDHAD